MSPAPVRAPGVPVMTTEQELNFADFVEKVKNRYAYYYNKLDDIKSKIDEFAKYIDKSQKANFERWDILGVYVWPNPVYDLTYEQEVERLKNWIEERMNWLNSNF